MQIHEQIILSAIREQRVARPGVASTRLATMQTELSSDVDVLNYALTLEHLEAAFYRLTNDFDLGVDPFGNSINDWLTLAGEQEAAHVVTLTEVITQLGGEPVAEATYDFGVADSQGFLATAATLENVGVAAYDGAGQFLQSQDLLTAAGSIVAVEARHAAYLNLLTGTSPFPAATETPMTPDEVLAAAGGFIVASS
ncbi:MAG TPA: ferritin-like domain-containing protein [Thermomicrobiales bacterium]|nr:ferritin-like domain-containing protein [Thermomicrobiales bacterium]